MARYKAVGEANKGGKRNAKDNKTKKTIDGTADSVRRLDSSNGRMRAKIHENLVEKGGKNHRCRYP